MLTVILFVLELLAFSEGRSPNIFHWNSKIVNDNDVKEGEIPFQVSLQTTFGHFCGGSVLNENYILTAAHCTVGKVPQQIRITVGTTSLQKPYATYQASQIIAHTDYDPYNYYINDIALIKVKEPIAFSELVQPVTLPESQWKVRANSSAVVSGWGRLGGSSGQLPDILQKAQILITDQEYCKKIMQERYQVIHPTHICANDPNDRRGQCNGDSGGPLTVEGKIVGIVSWSIKDPFCASTKYPGVYTRVPEYINWLQENVVSAKTFF